jgi:hypothetical protein
LLKLLRDGQQNKQIVAETIISLGQSGETELIAIVKMNKSENRLLNNNKAKECIIKAFALSDILNPNIDFVIQTLFFTYTKESDPKVRMAALIALDILHKRL